MPATRRQKNALRALNYNLFETEQIQPPAPATMYTRLQDLLTRDRHEQERYRQKQQGRQPGPALPPVEELYSLFDRINWQYFDGALPPVKIEYSNRMTSAGSYTPARRVIKIGCKYHMLFPDELEDTLKHEMIHIRHFRHDAAFKAEARRIGASLKARSHPSLQKPPKYVYVCPECGQRYPRHKRLVMASCGRCSAKGRYDPRYKLSLLTSRARQQAPSA
jgi:predicted SprT family Zn-dependent metalloprotease